MAYWQTCKRHAQPLSLSFTRVSGVIWGEQSHWTGECTPIGSHKLVNFWLLHSNLAQTKLVWSGVCSDAPQFKSIIAICCSVYVCWQERIRNLESNVIAILEHISQVMNRAYMYFISGAVSKPTKYSHKVTSLLPPSRAWFNPNSCPAQDSLKRCRYVRMNVKVPIVCV